MAKFTKPIRPTTMGNLSTPSLNVQGNKSNEKRNIGTLTVTNAIRSDTRGKATMQKSESRERIAEAMRQRAESSSYVRNTKKQAASNARKAAMSKRGG